MPDASSPAESSRLTPMADKFYKKANHARVDPTSWFGGRRSTVNDTSSATVREEIRTKRFPFRQASKTAEPGTKSQPVEIWSGNHKPKVLYSPVADLFGKNTETEAVACKPDSKNVVQQGDAFHITVEGFYTTPDDFSFAPEKEVFLYSLEYLANSPALLKNLYDYKSRNAGGDLGPYVFSSVPSPGNLLLTHSGVEGAARTITNTDVHLRLVEVADNIRSRRLLNDITKLNSAIVPQFAETDRQTLSEMLDCIGGLSQGVVDELGDPETSFNCDLSFKIASKAPDPVAEFDTYLRYGVYYFLRRPSRAKLYAQTSVAQNARLMVRMMDEFNRGGVRADYAEFAETTYLSMRVHRGPDQTSHHSGAPSKTISVSSLFDPRFTSSIAYRRQASGK